VSAPLAAIVDGALDRESLAALLRSLETLARRSVELIVVGGAALPDGPWRAVAAAASTPASRNAAVSAARADRFVFVGELPPAQLLAPACALLDRRPDVACVTAWVDGLPGRGSVATPLGIADLLARPWIPHAPTVMRKDAWLRAGGFDESLTGCEDVDLLLRVLLGGDVVLGLADPGLHDRAWGPGFDWLTDGAGAVVRRLYEKHRALFEARWDAALLGKERIVRELYEARAVVDERVRTLARRAAALDEERALLEAALTRLGS
jgi:hypothetical protein